MPQLKCKRVIGGGGHRAVLFDLDGVIMHTASLHARCWKRLFESTFKRAQGNARNISPLRYHDGRPRFDAIRDFLKSHDIRVPEDALILRRLTHWKDLEPLKATRFRCPADAGAAAKHMVEASGVAGDRPDNLFRLRASSQPGFRKTWFLHNLLGRKDFSPSSKAQC